MITCAINQAIDAAKADTFEPSALEWMRLVNKPGGQRHGYFLPSEAASDQALAQFSFENLAAHEVFRSRFGKDPEFVAADDIRETSGCVLRHERTLVRPPWR